MKTYKKETQSKHDNDIAELIKAGITITDISPFCEFVIIGGSIYETQAVLNSLDDANAVLEEPDNWYADLTEAFTGIISESKPEFEVCSNGEWLEIYGGFEQTEENNDNSHTDWDAFEEHVAAIKSLFNDDYVEFVAPKNNRCLLHQWNVAPFTHHNRGVGTFVTLTKEFEAKFNAV